MDEKDAALLTGQFRHANALMQARVNALEGRLAHQQALNNQRLAALEEEIRDHE
ncbi:MAG: hypothetical protein H0S82_08850, partial [Anaerolineaceae bacterium]|nr:hypothetical protein [Anaerolineaceae bacterium]